MVESSHAKISYPIHDEQQDNLTYETEDDIENESNYEVSLVGCTTSTCTSKDLDVAARKRVQP